MTASAGIEKPDRILDALEQVAEFGVPRPETAALLDIGSSRYLDFVKRELLDDLVAQGGATCRFFEGAYGSGKTHLLDLLYGLALDGRMAVALADLSQALSLEDWRLITLHVLQSIEARVDGEVVRSLPEILHTLGRSGRAHREALARAPLPHAGFRAAMLLAVDGDLIGTPAEEVLTEYLSGQRVRVASLRAAGVTRVKDPLSQRNAEQVLGTALGGLWHLGLRGTMLLFDENEQTLPNSRAPTKRAQMAANLMRRLIDGCTTGNLTGTLAVFAVLPGFLSNCALNYPALGQRLHMARDESLPPAWRWPVLPIEAVTTVRDADEFLAQAVEVFVSAAAMWDIADEPLRRQLLNMGEDVLGENVGSGYRRPLMKRLAAYTLRQIEPQ